MVNGKRKKERKKGEKEGKRKKERKKERKPWVLRAQLRLHQPWLLVGQPSWDQQRCQLFWFGFGLVLVWFWFGFGFI